MSFDIYGNRLQRGHCEVHPDIPEEYPCSVCLAEHEPEPTYPEPEPCQESECSGPAPVTLEARREYPCVHKTAAGKCMHPQYPMIACLDIMPPSDRSCSRYEPRISLPEEADRG